MVKSRHKFDIVTSLRPAKRQKEHTKTGKVTSLWL